MTDTEWFLFILASAATGLALWALIEWGRSIGKCQAARRREEWALNELIRRDAIAAGRADPIERHLHRRSDVKQELH